MSSKSDASTKIVGFKYQEMVALKECFEAKDGTKFIWSVLEMFLMEKHQQKLNIQLM